MSTAEAAQETTPPKSTGPGPECPKRMIDVVRVFFRHASPRILVVLAMVAVGIRVAHSAFDWQDLGIALGLVVAWPAVEWLIHVFLLHFRPLHVGGKVWDPKVSQAHRAHHREPWQANLIFVPLHTYFLSVPLITLLWLGPLPLTYGLTGLAATALLALHYEWVHHLLHTRYVPKTGMYKAMWKHHRLHHMKNEQYWFGVTTRFADKLLATDGRADHVPTSETCRSLF